MATWVADISVFYKKGVRNPEALVIQKTLMGITDLTITKIHTGKTFQIFLESDSKDQVKSEVAKFCEKLLANPVLEKYTYEVSKEV